MNRDFPGGESCAMFVATTMENIGVMMHQRIVPAEVVSNLLGNSSVILWRRLETWAVALREELDNPGAFEWFQWLALILEGFQDSDKPAYITHADWEPNKFRSEL